MIRENILFHNVDEIEENRIGLKLYRAKKEVCASLNPVAREMNRAADGCELRFVTEAPMIRITLYCDDDFGEVIVFCGDNMLSSHRVTKSGFMTFTAVDNKGFKSLENGFFDGEERRFSKDVWRIYFHSFRCTLVDVETFEYPIRVPNKDEMPKKTLLSYGSSISHGAITLFHPDSFPQTFARLAKMDCLIKGTASSCFAEKATADDFAQRDDWDVALLELGINMLGFETEVFEERFNYFADKMAKTGKKLIFVTMFPCGDCYRDGEKADKFKSFNEIIRKKCSSFDDKQCLLLEGKDILTSTTWLMCDNLHPSTEGHVMMGINLYNKAKDFLNE